MKSKIMSILICIGIMIILTGCGNNVNNVKTVQTFEKGDLSYCNSQNIFANDGDTTKKIEVYEDLEHNKLVYVTLYRGYNTDVSVIDNNSVKNVQKHGSEGLKYYGSQNICTGDGETTKKVEIYEDLDHEKLVYVTLYRGYNINISVIDSKSSNAISVADDNSKSNKN